MLSGGIVLAGDRGGLDAIEEAGQCPEHGLHQIEVDAVLVRLNGKITVGIAAAGERPGQPGSGLQEEGYDGLPGGLIHPAGHRREKFPLKEHNGLQSALPKDPIWSEPRQKVVEEGQLPQHGLQAADRLADQADLLRHNHADTPLSSAEPRVMGWPGY